MDSVNCPKCKRPVAKDIKFCPWCGAKLNGTSKTISITMKKSSFRVLLTCFIACLTIIIAAIGGSMVYRHYLSPEAKDREKALVAVQGYALEYGDRISDMADKIPFEDMVFELYENGDPYYYHILVRDKNGPKDNLASFAHLYVHKKTFEVVYFGEIY